VSAQGTERGGAPATEEDLDRLLQSFVGTVAGPKTRGADPVNLPMIRHWVEATGDHNPVYVDEVAAREAGFEGIIAPPTMLQAWIMRGLRASMEVEEARAKGVANGDSVIDHLMTALDLAGYTSVVATNCDQHYERPLRLGDHLEVTSTIDSVSAEKETALGTGRFVTTRLEYVDQNGELVATMLFRILKFKPRAVANGSSRGPTTGTGHESTTGPSDQERPRRPRPALTQDNRFFFDGAKQGKLLIQRCASCGTLRHPPRPACPVCRSFEWDTQEASGRGTVFSYVVNHYPQVPAFDYPLLVALVELEEGTRLVANLSGVEPEKVAIGMPVVAEFVEFDDNLTLPVFRPTSEKGDRQKKQSASRSGKAAS
jgi:uncharacterized protein